MTLLKEFAVWSGLTIAVTVFFLCISATLHVRTLVQAGGLANIENGCVALIDQDNLDGLVDISLTRELQFYGYDRIVPMASILPWHAYGAFVYLGSQLAYSKDQRRQMVLPALRQLPIC